MIRSEPLGEMAQLCCSSHGVELHTRCMAWPSENLAAGMTFFVWIFFVPSPWDHHLHGVSHYLPPFFAVTAASRSFMPASPASGICFT